jgi:hypothetical protein
VVDSNVAKRFVMIERIMQDVTTTYAIVEHVPMCESNTLRQKR